MKRRELKEIDVLTESSYDLRLAIVLKDAETELCDCNWRRTLPHLKHANDCKIQPIHASVIRDIGLPTEWRWMWAIDIFGYWYEGSKELM